MIKFTTIFIALAILCVLFFYRHKRINDDLKRSLQSEELLRVNLKRFNTLSSLQKLQLPFPTNEAPISIPDSALLHKSDSLVVAIIFSRESYGWHVLVVSQTPDNRPQKLKTFVSSGFGIFKPTETSNRYFYITEQDVNATAPFTRSHITENLYYVENVHENVITNRRENPRHGRPYRCSTDSDCRANYGRLDARREIISWKRHVTSSDSTHLISWIYDSQ